jgi:hypothetical protein
MEMFALISFVFVAALTAIMLVVGQSRHWGITPVGLLGLGFIIPFLMLLLGIL